MKGGWSKVSFSSVLWPVDHLNFRIGALDSGAHGIVVPLLYNADDAKRLVQSAKFPPVGQRGYGSPFTMHAFKDPTGLEYLDQANEGLVTIVQIETKEGLQNVSGMNA